MKFTFSLIATVAAALVTLTSVGVQSAPVNSVSLIQRDDSKSRDYDDRRDDRDERDRDRDDRDDNFHIVVIREFIEKEIVIRRERRSYHGWSGQCYRFDDDRDDGHDSRISHVRVYRNNESRSQSGYHRDRDGYYGHFVSNHRFNRDRRNGGRDWYRRDDHHDDERRHDREYRDDEHRDDEHRDDEHRDDEHRDDDRDDEHRDRRYYDYWGYHNDDCGKDDRDDFSRVEIVRKKVVIRAIRIDQREFDRERDERRD